MLTMIVPSRWESIHKLVDNFSVEQVVGKEIIFICDELTEYGSATYTIMVEQIYTNAMDG